MLPLLWSLDADNRSVGPVNASASRQLAAGTDVPLDWPPEAVTRWNHGDHCEFPATNESVSIAPPDAARTNSTVIADAYVKLFAITPSTRARILSKRHHPCVSPNPMV